VAKQIVYVLYRCFKIKNERGYQSRKLLEAEVKAAKLQIQNFFRRTENEKENYLA